MTDNRSKAWSRDLTVATLVTWVVYLLMFAIKTFLRLRTGGVRGEVWILLGALLSGLILVGRGMRQWAALSGITGATVIGLAIGFAWTARHFREDRLMANLVGLAYIGAIAVIGGAVGLALGFLLRRVLGSRRGPRVGGVATK